MDEQSGDVSDESWCGMADQSREGESEWVSELETRYMDSGKQGVSRMDVIKVVTC